MAWAAVGEVRKMKGIATSAFIPKVVNPLITKMPNIMPQVPKVTHLVAA